MESNYTINLNNSYIETKGDIHIWNHKESMNVNMCNHLHTYNELEIIISGKGLNEFTNFETPLKTGSVYIIPPFISHRIDMNSDLEIITVSFNDRLIKYPNLLKKIKSGVNYLDLTDDELASIHNKLEKIQALIYSNEVFREEMISALFNTIIVTILKTSEVYNPYDLDNDMPTKLKSAILYINNNFSKDISLTNVADVIKLTPNHLSAIFKKQLGVSYIDYVCEQRLERSKTLMSDPELSINTISKMVGFNSPAYFADRFKKRYGLSPMKYRNDNK